VKKRWLLLVILLSVLTLSACSQNEFDAMVESRNEGNFTMITRIKSDQLDDVEFASMFDGDMEHHQNHRNEQYVFTENGNRRTSPRN